MSKLVQKLKHVPAKAAKGFEAVYLYNVPVVYASVHQPKKKYNSDEQEYTITVFVTEDVANQLLGEPILANKETKEVGKGLNKKRKLKYPLTRDDGSESVYAPYKGLHGLSLTLPALSKKGQPLSVNVVNDKGEVFEDLIGNGSVCHVKVSGYRNNDSMLNLRLDTVVVVDHVAYSGSNADEVVDDEFGFTIQRKKPQQKQDSGFDDGVPFDTDDANYE